MKYPNGIKKQFTNKINTSNRGMSLEEDINITNEYYRSHDIAVVYKKPTPITVNKVDYKARNDAVIKEAHFLVPSTTDYNGIYKGMYIDFEAKETRKEYFPLANIHNHQIEHLQKIQKHKGIGFIIVKFVLDDEIYLLKIEDLINFIQQNTRKSIPRDYFNTYGYKLKIGYQPRIDYIKIIEQIRSEQI